jgi:copper chaperone CopZ
MKTSRCFSSLRTLSLSAVMLFCAVNITFSADKAETIKVSGNCGSCKKRIEKAVKEVQGVQSATWDKNTKMLAVKFDDSKTNVKSIQDKIISVGHDIESTKAADATYASLPKCCKYREAGAKTH